MDCQITDISLAARRAGGSVIAMEIGADSEDAASGISGGLSPDNINAELAKAGLPAATILSAPSVAVGDNYVNTSLIPLPLGNSSSFFTQEVGPLKMWMWMAVGGGVVVMCCCLSMTLLCHRRKKVGSDDNALEDKPADREVDIENGSKPKPMENASTLTGDLVFEKVSSEEEA